MVTVYPAEYIKRNEVKELSFFTSDNSATKDAKKDRDRTARQMRKEGWTVKCSKSSMFGNTGYFINAHRPRQ